MRKILAGNPPLGRHFIWVFGGTQRERPGGEMLSSPPPPYQFEETLRRIVGGETLIPPLELKYEFMGQKKPHVPS